MKVLLDTCAICDYRRPTKYPGLVAYIDCLPDDALFLSVLTLGEITRGIEALPATQKQIDLRLWYAGLIANFQDRILLIDPETAEIWGRLTAVATPSSALPAIDGLIAATALRHGLSVLTRNEKHFRLAGVGVINPWPNQVSPPTE